MGYITIEYQYRDSDNYKRDATKSFKNPDGLSPELVRQAFEAAFRKIQVFPDVLSFDPAQLGWESLFFNGHDVAGSDISLHEIVNIEAVDESIGSRDHVNDLMRRITSLTEGGR
jgi:hypothetical protein